MMINRSPKCAVVEYGACRFLICDSPSDSSLAYYIKEFSAQGVTDVVRVCEASYSADRVRAAGISLHESPFADGSASPPPPVICSFLQTVDERAREAKERAAKEANDENGMAVICIHCVAGLGRAPMLVALALIEMGMRQLEAVELIREKRRGAFTTKQLTYICSYKGRGLLRRWSPGGAGLKTAPSTSLFPSKKADKTTSLRLSFTRIFNRSSSRDSKLSVVAAN